MHICVPQVCPVPESSRRGCSGTGDLCEQPYRCWDSYPGPLEEQPILVTTEPPLQCLELTVFVCIQINAFHCGIFKHAGLMPMVSASNAVLLPYEQ